MNFIFRLHVEVFSYFDTYERWGTIVNFIFFGSTGQYVLVVSTLLSHVFYFIFFACLGC